MSGIVNPDPDTRKVALGSISGFLAFGLGAGLFRFAPGTMGTLVAVPFALLFISLPFPWFWPALAILFLVGVRLCGVTARKLGRHDPGGIVWDEMVGYWLCIAFVPLSWPWWLAAFVLFRIFDIVKPWPIRWVENRLGGGLGIMMDDVIAALYAIAALFLMNYVFTLPPA